MSTDFSTSITKQNIMRAFAGECQAHLRYSFAKQLCDAQKDFVIGMLFKFTSAQEKEHAEIFYNYLKQQNVSDCEFAADYPVVTGSDICKLLSDSLQSELREANDIYPSFAAKAREEGFSEIAQSIENIALIERSHAERFRAFLELYQNGRLYSSEQPERWICMNCGYILESDSVPEKCPVCSADRGYYIRLSMSGWGL